MCVNIKSLGQSSRRKTVKQSGYFGKKGLDWDFNWCRGKVINQREGFRGRRNQSFPGTRKRVRDRIRMKIDQKSGESSVE